ncbi:MAG: HEAT repeat domain-containing protein [Bradymonadia bacterium]
MKNFLSMTVCAGALLFAGQAFAQGVSGTPAVGEPVSTGPVSGMPHAHAPRGALPAATPRGPEVAQKALESWFRGFEFVPTAAHFAQLGPDLEPALLTIARNHDDMRVRARAISSMVYAPTPTVKRFLVELSTDASAVSLERRKAVLVLADLYGAEVLDTMVKVYDSAPTDAPLREACARGFRAAGEAGMPIRQQMLGRETVASVKALLNVDKQLQ